MCFSGSSENEASYRQAAGSGGSGLCILKGKKTKKDRSGCCYIEAFRGIHCLTMKEQLTVLTPYRGGQRESSDEKHLPSVVLKPGLLK